MKVVLATANKGKLKELQALLDGTGIEVVPQSEFGIETPEETGLTFVENAILKARYAAQASQLPAIADDSGIEIDALQGRPGIYSARYAGPQATDEQNNRKLLEELQAVPAERRTARYRCVLVMMRTGLDPAPAICEGVWEGRIGTEPQGMAGFGYDPLFIVEDQGMTAAQMPADVKNRLSHRGQALNKLVTTLREMKR